MCNSSSFLRSFFCSSACSCITCWSYWMINSRMNIFCGIRCSLFWWVWWFLISWRLRFCFCISSSSSQCSSSNTCLQKWWFSVLDSSSITMVRWTWSCTTRCFSPWCFDIISFCAYFFYTYFFCAYFFSIWWWNFWYTIHITLVIYHPRVQRCSWNSKMKSHFGQSIIIRASIVFMSIICFICMIFYSLSTFVQFDSTDYFWHHLYIHNIILTYFPSMNAKFISDNRFIYS